MEQVYKEQRILLLFTAVTALLCYYYTPSSKILNLFDLPSVIVRTVGCGFCGITNKVCEDKKSE